MAIENLYSFPQEENPFCHDLYHMGEYFSDEVVIMYDSKKEYIIFVHKPTGKRRRLDIKRLFSEEFFPRQEIGHEDIMQVILKS